MSCRPCPTGVPISLVLLGVFLATFVVYLGPKLSKLTSPQALALLRSLVSYLQNLSLSFDIRLAWPSFLLSFFSWLKTLTNGIDFAAPECVATNWSYYLCTRESRLHQKRFA